MADTPAKERPPQQWPSPWPYDFPVETTTAPRPTDKVARVQGAAPAPVAPATPQLQLTRRSLFGPALLGWGAFLTAGGVGTLGLVRFLFPNVSFEAPQSFATAPPSQFAPGTVDETWKGSAVWIVNTDGYIFALSTVCTHLGCTPDWKPADSKFKCPCHGSGYYMNGVNFEGPTPRPLERFRVFVSAEDGNLWVDKNTKCQVELGTCDSATFRIPAA
jgi:cytochrome b6-f complex iron-sulfur subunit